MPFDVQAGARGLILGLVGTKSHMGSRRATFGHEEPHVVTKSHLKHKEPHVVMKSHMGSRRAT